MGKQHNTIYLLIILILIIAILLMLFFVKLGKIDNNASLIPTGRVDVFDIDINCQCDNNKTCNDDKTDNKHNGIPVYQETYKDVVGEVFVDDASGNFIYQQNLKIFENSAFEFTNKVAPGVSNTYQFVVHNSTNAKMKYYIEMYETSEYAINMKYRLKNGNTYVIGGPNKWVSANELKTAFKAINASSSDNYSLDWQWVYDDNKDYQDTLAGENMNSTYKLNVRFYIEQMGE